MHKLLIIAFTLLTGTASASHIVGGDIYYDYLGNNNYQFFLSVYRDCNSSGAAFDDPLVLTVYNSSNQMIQNLSLPFPGSTMVPTNFSDPCLNTAPDVCTQQAIYTTIVNLPPTAGGYTISYQRCCRGPAISNLNNPDDTGFTLSCVVPGTANNNFINSSPRFTGYP